MTQSNRVTPLDYSTLGGGLSRMMDRYADEGTLTGDAEEDDFLRRHPAAALLGLLFDQRVRAESAFTGPRRLFLRIGHLDFARIAAMELGELQAIFAPPPLAVHRFTNMMAGYTHKVAQAIVEKYDGDVTKLWDDGADSHLVQQRVQTLPGFGPGKSAKIKYVLHYLGYRDFSGEEHDG